MTIKSDNIQIGANATATNNFVLKQGNDGTVTLARGNVGATTQDILTVDAAGLVTLTNGKQLTLGTAQATTSGTSIDFTGIPSWAKRITVMFNGVSTNGTSNFLIQIGYSGGITNTGYLGAAIAVQSGAISSASATSTAGFIVAASISVNTELYSGSIAISNISGNLWIESGMLTNTVATRSTNGSGSLTLAGTLDRIRLTTVNGTDTFDAGSVNIMYEG